MENPQFYGVRTTLIFCRFGCPSKQPRPENVSYLATIEEAALQGFRPCKRCRPDLETAPATALGHFISGQMLLLSAERPEASVEDLANALFLSKRQLERLVKQATGESPRALIRSQPGGGH
jgi:methylphosphotriester-DNA--protein-cysteine methyltransferase